MCTKALAGTYIVSPNMPAAACSAGFFSGDEAVECTRVPAGYFSSDSVSVVPCSNGTYSVGGAVSCSTCPSGHSCGDTNRYPIACSAGSFSLAGSVACTACPEGAEVSFSSSGYVLSCNFVPTVFSYPLVGQCPFTDRNVTSACPVGHYSGGGQSACTPCPPGHMCAGPFV